MLTPVKVSGFRNQRFSRRPLFEPRPRKQPPGWVRFIGLKEQQRSLVANRRVFLVEVVDQGHELRLRSFQILVHDAIFVVRAFPGRDDQEVAVLGDLGIESPSRIRRIGMDERVLRLFGPQPMVKNLLIEVQALEGLAFFRSIVGTVEEALIIGRPGGHREFRPVDFVVQQFSGVGFHNIPNRPVRPAFGSRVGDILPSLLKDIGPSAIVPSLVHWFGSINTRVSPSSESS